MSKKDARYYMWVKVLDGAWYKLPDTYSETTIKIMEKTMHEHTYRVEKIDE